LGKVIKFDPRKRTGRWSRGPETVRRTASGKRWPPQIPPGWTKAVDQDGAPHRRFRLRKVTPPHGRRLRDSVLVTITLILAVIGLARGTPKSIGRFGLVMGLRHLLAAPNCDSARAVGLAPANRGEPGYWPDHDRDKDGIACEPWPRRS
jgi:hypothetical protein